MPPAPPPADIHTGHVAPDAVALAREAEAIGRDLGARYELRGFLARGGFASVWAATDHTGGQELAVKRLDPRVGRRRDFYRELRAMFVVEHPNVVRIVNVLEAGGTRYLLLELCRGGSLRAPLSRARRNRQNTDPRAARQIVGQIARGLAAVHARGFTHRDLKPENVLFTDRTPDPLATGGAVKLADFGLTDLLTADEGALRGLTGSPAYMAPEQFSGAPEPASDVYALGVVALELLTGDVPFIGTAEELAAHHIFTPPPVPSGLPEVWSELLPAMLAKSPGDRPPAAHVADRLGWGEARPAPTPPAILKERRTVNPNATPNEKAGLDREARRAKSALDELAAFSRARGRPVPAPEPPAPVADEVPTGFFDGYAPEPSPTPSPEPVANNDWFGEESPAIEGAFAEDARPRDEIPTDEVFIPAAGPQDTLALEAGAAQDTPAGGYPHPPTDPNGIDDVLDSFNW